MTGPSANGDFYSMFIDASFIGHSLLLSTDLPKTYPFSKFEDSIPSILKSELNAECATCLLKAYV